MKDLVKLNEVLEGYCILRAITISPKGAVVTAHISMDEEDELNGIANRQTNYLFEFLEVTSIRITEQDRMVVPELNSQVPVSLQLIKTLTRTIFRNQLIYEWSVFSPVYPVGGKYKDGVDISINPTPGTPQHRAVFFKESSNSNHPGFFWTIMIDFKTLKIKNLEGKYITTQDFLHNYRKYL